MRRDSAPIGNPSGWNPSGWNPSGWNHWFCDRDGVPVMSWPPLDALGVEAIVTTRDGGVSVGPYESLNLGLTVGDDPGNVVTNRSIAARLVGSSLDDLVLGDQVHANRTAVVTGEHRGRGARDRRDALGGTDALVTVDPGVVLAVLVADCVPIVLFDPAVPALGVVHAGWRGLVTGVIASAVAAMVDLGSDPSGVTAGIGPAASPKTYQVGNDVATEIQRMLLVTPGSRCAGVAPEVVAQVMTPHGSDRWLLNLWEASRTMLVYSGIHPENILVTDVATGGSGPFFSHRQHNPCGRFALLAKLRN